MVYFSYNSYSMEKNVERFVSGIITSIENIVITKRDNDLEIGTNNIETTICLDGKETYKLTNGINLNKGQKIGLYFNIDKSKVEAIIDNEKKFNLLLERQKTNKSSSKMSRLMLFCGFLLLLPLCFRTIFSEDLYGLSIISIFSCIPFFMWAGISYNIKQNTLSQKDKENIENYLNETNVENNKEKQKVILNIKK